ncbi:hypothetical protein ACIGW1_21125 [Streptomyces sp. NPDC053780]|uniref:hypothetical protein n=1 Tax=unclassified Streptomyces TaxID=2593676 RepID=UPI00343E499B
MTASPATEVSDAAEEERRASPRGTVLNVIGVHLYLERPDGTVLLGLREPDKCTPWKFWAPANGELYSETGWPA